MTKYAVISNDPDAFFFVRYSTRERALLAIGGNHKQWSIYVQEEITLEQKEKEQYEQL